MKVWIVYRRKFYVGRILRRNVEDARAMAREIWGEGLTVKEVVHP